MVSHSRPAFLVLAALFLVFRLYLAEYTKEALSRPPHISANDLLSPQLSVSDMARTHTTLEDSVHFQMNDHEEWESLTPSGGLFRLEEGGDIVSIGMFHELRCLNTLRRRQLGLQIDEAVLGHCINYMRQAALCRASPRVDTLLGGGIGYYSWTPRECRDETAVYEAVISLQQAFGAS